MSAEERNAKIISFVIIAALLVTIWYMLDLALLTFFLCFIFYNLVGVIKRAADKVLSVKIPEGLILSVCYCLLVALIIIFFSEVLPIIVEWGQFMAQLFKDTDLEALFNGLDPRVLTVLDYVDINSMVQSLGVKLSALIATYSTQVAEFLINLFLALLLSFLILLEKNDIKEFGRNVEKSRFSYIYKYLVKFGGNFTVTFGKVMTVQVTIACVNSVLSMIALAVMGFPAIPALGLMIFALGLIPVAGVVISMIPLSVIALSIGGIVKVVEVIIMICVLHAIEAYILNPKLMSSKTRLPVCFVFIVLIVGQRYMGVWGLLTGVPIFIFVMNMLEVDYQVDKKKNKQNRKNKNKNKNALANINAHTDTGENTDTHKNINSNTYKEKDKNKDSGGRAVD